MKKKLFLLKYILLMYVITGDRLSKIKIKFLLKSKIYDSLTINILNSSNQVDTGKTSKAECAQMNQISTYEEVDNETHQFGYENINVFKNLAHSYKRQAGNIFQQ